MNSQAKKLDFIDWLVNLKDESLLKKLYSIKEENDWFHYLPKEAIESIERGQKDYKVGKTIPQEHVMAEMKAKYKIK